MSSQNQLPQRQHTATAPNQASSAVRQSSSDDASRRQKNWKLIVDPLLVNLSSSAGQSKTAPQKVFRTEGIASGYPPVLQVRDPRTRPTPNWPIPEALDLAVPKFKIDSNYVGTPPAVEVSITNLNDNVNCQFLSDIIKKFGESEDLQIFYHPKNQKHLGMAKLTFESPKAAKMCVEKLNQTSIMGKIVNVFLDPFAREINKCYENAVNPPPPPPVIANYEADPHVIHLESSRVFPFRPTVFNSDQGLSEGWSDNNRHYPVTHSSRSSSPVRESLDSRIESLFRHRVSGKSCLGEVGGFTGSAPFDVNDFHRDSPGINHRFDKLDLHQSRMPSGSLYKVINNNNTNTSNSNSYYSNRPMRSPVKDDRNKSRRELNDKNRSENDDGYYASKSSSRNYINHRNRGKYLNVDVMDQVISELAEIIKKDLKKKMIESTGFSHFESWWDENESRSREENKNSVNIQSKDNNEAPVTIDTVEKIMSVIQKNMQEATARSSHSYGGGGLGLGGIRRQMPSFKRKPVFKNEDDWDEEGDKRADSDDEITNDVKNRVKHPVSDSDSSETSDDDSEYEVRLPRNRKLVSSRSPSKSSISSSSSRSSSRASSSSSSSASSSSDGASASDISDSEHELVKNKEQHAQKTSKLDANILDRNICDSRSDIVSSSDEHDIEKSPQVSLEEKKSDDKIVQDDSINKTSDDEAALALIALSCGDTFGSTVNNDTSQEENFSGTDNDDSENANRSSISFDHSYALPSKQEAIAIDSTIDSVIRGSLAEVQLDNDSNQGMANVDHLYSRGTKTAANKKLKKPLISDDDDIKEIAVASEWRKAKKKQASKIVPIDSPPVISSPPAPLFRKRTREQEDDILHDCLKNGIDEEDLQFLKQSFENHLEDESGWLNDTHWVPCPPTLVSPPKKKRKATDARVHVTGCARTEGFYKLNIQEKRQHSYCANPPGQEKEKDDTKPVRARGIVGQTSSREARSNQRRLLTVADSAWSDLLKFNQLQVRLALFSCFFAFISPFFVRLTVP